MKILIITRDPWREDNSFGNSFNNIFRDLPDVELAQICCGPGLPQTNTLSKFYYINEKSLVKNLLNSKNPSALNIDLEKDLLADENFEENNRNVNHMKFFQKNRLRIFFILREIIWKISRWKSKELEKFVKDFNPDLIFVQLTTWPFVNNVALHVQKISGAKMVSYMSDDNYTLKQFSLDPSFWMYRLIQRIYVKKIIQKSEIFYVISDKQKKEYDEIFKINSKLLYKSTNFDEKVSYNVKNAKKLRFLFTGNIEMGRYKSLFQFGKILEIFNKTHASQHELVIFTNSPLKDSLIKKFSGIEYTKLNSAIPFAEVIKQQLASDVLIHVESFQLKEKLSVRHSFSTKLVDYFAAGKPILAIGPKDVASMEYLKENDAAFICNDFSEIEKFLILVDNNINVLKKYADKSFFCGYDNHNEKTEKMRFCEELKKLIN